MSSFMPNAIACGDSFLRIPCMVNIKALSESETRAFCDQIQEGLGTSYFRDQDLLMQVIEDYRLQAQDPFRFAYGPYLHITPKDHHTDHHTLRLTACQSIVAGTTVYAQDQLLAMLEDHHAALTRQHADKHIEQTPASDAPDAPGTTSTTHSRLR